MQASNTSGVIAELARALLRAGAYLVVLLALYGAGCAGPGSMAGPTAAAGERQGWPAFPGDTTPGHTAVHRVASGAVAVYGNEYASQDGANNYDDPQVPNAYVIIPGGGTQRLAYAQYALQGLDTMRPVSIDFTVSAAPLTPGGAENLPLKYYIGVSNYTRFRWKWFGPYTIAQPSITLNDKLNDKLDRYVSSDASSNTLQVVIVTAVDEQFVTGQNPMGLTAARIEQFTVNTLSVGDADYGATRPHYAAIDSIGAPGGKGGSALDPATQYVELSWTHLADPYGAGLSAASYDVYRKGPDDEHAIAIGAVDAPTATYTDPTDNDPGVLEPVAGATYIYYLRAVNAAGSTPFDEQSYTIPVGPAIIITGYEIQAVGATGGTGAGGDIFADGAVGTVVANQALTMALQSVSGTWEGEAFDAATFPGTMTQADYDTIKAAVTAALQWEFINQGDAQARYTSAWFVPTAAYAGAGDPGAGTVCPDDDPESTGASREGLCAVTLPAGSLATGDPLLTINVPSDVAADFGFDLTPDPVAPIIEGYYTGPDFGTHVTELQTGAGNTTIFFKMTSWGATGAALPADGSSCKLQVIRVDGKDASGLPLELTWYTGAGGDPGVGEFYFYHAPPPLDFDVFICKVPGAAISIGSAYAIRFSDGTTFSTINLPAETLGGDPGVPVEDLLTLPKVFGRNFDAPYYIQIFLNEPTVRCDGRMVLNLLSGSASPVDSVAYADVLKDPTTTSEFPISIKVVDVGGHPAYVPYPTIMIKEGTDASGFTEDDPDGIAGITIPLSGGRESGRLNVDITNLILNLPPPVSGDPPLNYCYKVFGATAEVGTGRFIVPNEPLELQTPVGAAWGINVGNRGDWNKLDFNLLCTNFAVNGSTMNTPTPDVLWVRFNGGTRMLGWDEYWSGATTSNVQLVIEDITEPATMYRGLSTVCIGVTANNDYIAIHHLNRNDGSRFVDWVDSPPNGGVLTPGHEYTLALDDSTTGTLDYIFPQTMAVVGNNPNL